MHKNWNGKFQVKFESVYDFKEVTLARIPESRITLVHPYSRSRSDKEDLFLFLIHDICGNDCKIDMPFSNDLSQ